MNDSSNDQNTPSKKPSKKNKSYRLPTPPPDPTEPAASSAQDKDENSEEIDKDKFLEYIFRRGIYSRSSSTFGPAIVTEEAFDHLEKLYKLMEQLLDLREQNAKLHRRIRDLEHLHNLEKLDHLSLEELYPDLDKNTAFAESILESILQDTAAKNKELQKQCKNLKPRRPRSGSGADKQVTVDCEAVGDLESQEKDDHVKPAKISKWTKVKAAFRWEKASTSVGDSKSQDSGIHVPINYELARYLRVPSTSDDAGHSPVDSGAGISTPGSISSASSNDDFHRGRAACEDFRSSDDDNPHPHNYIPHPKDYRSKSGQKCHHHRTPWAKMKDIIHTRNSFKKKHRLSAASDDIQIDIELCSDNEDVFEDDLGNKNTQLSLSPSPNVYSSSTSPSDLPLEIVERYQRALAEDSTSDSESKPSSSRWTRVRKAFLSHDGGLHELTEDCSVEEEIQRNYKKLQKKLSLEFQEKLSEWERMKQHSPGVSHPSPTFADDSRDSSFVKKLEEWEKIKSQSPTNKPRSIPSQFQLPPEFKKKLQEWEKIKRSSGDRKKKLGELPKCKSLGGHKSETPPVFECPVITDDFKKKLDEWRQIKAIGLDQKRTKDKTPSPKPGRKDSSPKGSKKHNKDGEKELNWFEKELFKIEKQKQRLERERQKFIEREERLSKLRRSVLGGTKRDVLIHTPSGFHRFEGISRKFTQKLYEWEKSKGIAPEDSTYALLFGSKFKPNVDTLPKRRTKANSPSLQRSKSADSIAISALNLTCPLMSQPSSLSLNDMEELEKECMKNSKMSLLQYSDDNLDVDEPEAVLVEIEDYEEETAEPLRTFLQTQQLPIYQRQECKQLCEGETVVGPKIRRSESARAQTNYDLIEIILALLVGLEENEANIRQLRQKDNLLDKDDVVKLQNINNIQNQSAKKLVEVTRQLKEANQYVVNSIPDDEKHTLGDALKAIQNSSDALLDLADLIDQNISNRTGEEISLSIRSIRDKITNLRRGLTHICISADASRRFGQKLEVQKTVSNESKESSDTSYSTPMKKYLKWEGNSNASNQGAVKKRIKSRQKSLQKNVMDSDDEENENKTVRQHKKLTRTRSISDSSVKELQVPMNCESTTSDSRIDSSPSDSAVTLFVKTTRQLFMPIAGKSDNVATLPPLPASPVPQRKIYKDVSPGIRLMISKYNQKLSEQESGGKSGGSSGSNSPVAWRSPVLERRVKAQTEKYQEGLKNMSPVLGDRKEIKKSLSTGVISSSESQANQQRKSSLYDDNQNTQPRGNLTLDIKLANKDQPTFCSFSPEVRMRKIQKAKEEFLRSGPVSAPSYISDEVLKFPTRNRLSQISVESENNYENTFPGTLVKSVSAGMINIDEDVYKKIDPEYRSEGYVSLPRSAKPPKQGKNAFSSIASKFRKVKMRRNKEKEKEKDKMNTVSALCRQSLVVNINNTATNNGNNTAGPSNTENNNNNNNNERREENNALPTSPGFSPISKSSSWIKKSIFKK